MYVLYFAHLQIFQLSLVYTVCLKTLKVRVTYQIRVLNITSIFSVSGYAIVI